MEYIDKRLSNVVNNLGIKYTKGKELDYFYSLQSSNNITNKEVITKEFNVGGDCIYIVPIADPHIGHTNCDVQKLWEYCKFIDSIDNCYTILLGDQTETATKSSVGMGMFDEDIHIPDQIEALTKIFGPLATKGKILGIIPGNHEIRVSQLVGINPMEILASRLKINYLGFQGFFELKVNGIPYHIMAHHGTGGGSTTGAKVNSVERLGRIAVVDLTISGHTHIRHVSEDLIYEIRDGKLVERKRFYVTCGSFLGYWRGYPEMKALTPVVPGGVCIQLMANTKNIHVIM